jgi:hypothetical protein
MCRRRKADGVFEKRLDRAELVCPLHGAARTALRRDWLAQKICRASSASHSTMAAQNGGRCRFFFHRKQSYQSNLGFFATLCAQLIDWKPTREDVEGSRWTPCVRRLEVISRWSFAKVRSWSCKTPPYGMRIGSRKISQSVQAIFRHFAAFRAIEITTEFFVVRTGKSYGRPNKRRHIPLRGGYEHVAIRTVEPPP